jgi:hypothetical protein
MAKLVSGLALGLAEDGEAGAAHLADAARTLDAANMPVYAAAARRALGVLAGSAAGAAQVREADVLMRSRGIIDPARFAAVLAPGLPSRKQ